MLNRILEQTLRYVTHNYLVVIFGDFYGADDQTIKLLKQISRHNDVIAGIIADEMDLNLGSDMIIGDGSEQINLGELTSDKKETFSRTQKEKLERFRETLISYRITPLQFNTHEPILNQIRKMLGGGR